MRADEDFAIALIAEGLGLAADGPRCQKGRKRQRQPDSHLMILPLIGRRRQCPCGDFAPGGDLRQEGV